MEIVYEVDIVPWCERIGKKEFGGNVDKCKKKNILKIIGNVIKIVLHK